MKYYCKHCGEMVVDTNNGDSIHLRDWEEELWGHIQMEHKDKFEEVQDFETPYMIEECYEEEDTEMEELLRIIKKLNMTKADVLREAELVEEYGEWSHMSLMGYFEDELREAAEMM